MKINKIIGLACALGVLGSFGNAECMKIGREGHENEPAAKMVRLSPKIKELIAQANDGNTAAQFRLGICYDYGVGVAKNPETAVQWYQKAAEQGHTWAQQECDRLTAKLARRLTEKANNGDAEAQYMLGCCYEDGKGVAKNPAIAFQWFEKAAAQEHPQAQYKLGWRNYNICSFGDAVAWFQKSADQGFAPAQYMLGWSYEYGYGVERNAKTAAEWYQKAAEQGHREAQFELGLRYDDGLGVAQDTEKALHWYQQAAAQGHISAQYACDLLTAKK